SECQPRSWAQIVLIINLRALEQSSRWPDKSVLVWIVDLPLMIVGKNEFVVPPISRLPIDVRTNQPTFREKMIDRTRIENRIWISGVAHGVSKQTVDAQLFVGRPADVGNRSRVAVVVIRPRVLGVEATCAH